MGSYILEWLNSNPHNYGLNRVSTATTLRIGLTRKDSSDFRFGVGRLGYACGKMDNAQELEIEVPIPIGLVIFTYAEIPPRKA